MTLTLKTPFYKATPGNLAFSVLGSSTCGNGLVLAPSLSCSMNIEFTPKVKGHTSQNISVQSDGYNSGVPVLTVQGTGN